MTIPDETRDDLPFSAEAARLRLDELLASPRAALESLETRLVDWIAEQCQQLGADSYDPFAPSAARSTEAISAGTDSIGFAEAQELAQEISNLQAQVERLEEENATFQALSEEANENSARIDRDENDLQKLYEMACDEIRQLKSELESCGPAAETGDELDWEMAKEKMLADLQAEDDLSAADRGRVETLIARTNEIVQQKDALIGLLEDRLKLTGVDDAIENILAADEFISQERERLSALQIAWEEKLRRAEIEISIERAKLAREKAGQDEQIRDLQGRLESQNEADPVVTRGRWLARLGLTEED
jgi:uncharacterized protein YdcH (DUF465 family)